MPRSAPRPPALRGLAARALAARALAVLALAVLALAAAPLTADAQLVRGASGASAADLVPVIEAFRADLGALNPNTPGSFGTGRREINWDGVPEALSSPNAFPGDFFNAAVAGRARGIAFATPGAGFEVSGNAGSGGFEFEHLNPTYPAQFQPFSAQKLFTALASNVTDVTFFVPGTTQPAAVRGFGAVFADVDLVNTTSLTLFGLDDALLGTFFAPAFGQGLSFLGISYADAIITRVRIISGNAVMGALDGAASDVVVMDDFIYGEPVAAVAVVPEPSTWLLLASGLAGLGGVAVVRRRRA